MTSDNKDCYIDVLPSKNLGFFLNQREWGFLCFFPFNFAAYIFSLINACGILFDFLLTFHPSGSLCPLSQVSSDWVGQFGDFSFSSFFEELYASVFLSLFVSSSFFHSFGSICPSSHASSDWPLFSDLALLSS